MKYYFASYTDTTIINGTSLTGDSIHEKITENKQIFLQDKHPLSWQKEMNDKDKSYSLVGITAKCTVTVLSWQEITEEEYNLHENV